MPAPVTPPELKETLSSITSSLCDNFIDTLLRFPPLVYKIFRWMFADDGAFSDEFKVDIRALTVFSGEVVMLAHTNIPDGWLACNGSAVSRTTYADLFAAIGETFGEGDAVNTFNLPDFRGKFPMGAGGAVAVAGTGGNPDHQITTVEMPRHTHRALDSSGSESNPLIGPGGLVRGFAAQEEPLAFITQEQAEENLEPTGGGDETGGEAFSLINPYLGITYIIKT